MKVDGQYPKTPFQDKNVQKGKEKEAIAQKLMEQNKSQKLRETKTSDFTVNKIKERINAEDDINIDKVNALKAKIKKGEYQIDVKKLASNLLKDSLYEDI